MVKRARMRRESLKVYKDGKFYTNVQTHEEYEKLLRGIDRRKHKVRLV